MDLKELNNYQLVLLTLLVSFITSIATGITTVYLLQQAPPQVTGVINNVVEKTIQTVAPSTDTGAKQQTIIIKEDDLIAAALAQGFQEVGALYTVSSAQASAGTDTGTGSSLPASAVLAQSSDATPTGTASYSLFSLGVLVDTNGTFVVPGAYTVTTGDYVTIAGSKYDVTQSTYVKINDITVLSITPQKDAKAFADLSPNGIGDLPKAGQTALVVGVDGAFIKTVISKVTASTNTTGGSIIKLTDSVGAKFAGAPVLSGDGKVIGIVTFDANGASTIYGADDITAALASPAPVPAK
jgi:hypothetical protein